jgi:glutamate formiminotransferase
MALRLADGGPVQVSMNLTDVDRTSLSTVFDAVTREAALDGVAVLESEIVGLVPARAVADVAARYLRLPRTARDLVLEARLGS